MSLKLGGTPLLLSMLDRHFREKDSPTHWPDRIRQWWENWQLTSVVTWFQPATTLKILEAIILGIILCAWIIPLFK
jgi:hypothetical protein